MLSRKLKLGITIGDINGIGPEIIIRTLADNEMLSHFTPVIYGSGKILNYYKKLLADPEGAGQVEKFSYSPVHDAKQVHHNKINVVNCINENEPINIGVPDENTGKAAFLALQRCVKDLKEKSIDGMVTAPVHKKTIVAGEAKQSFMGHTEFLTKEFGATDSLMMMVHQNLRIGTATSHVPIIGVSASLSVSKILNKIEIFNKSLKNDFGIGKPKIAVLGLNPHAGEEGLIGSEEKEMLIPAMEQAKAKNVFIFGPYSADGFFGSGNYAQFDGTLAMYHDQGLIPFKTLSQSKGVNFTAGLPIVRTSPDHGTANLIAGKNIADIDSFRNAIYLAIDIIRKRENTVSS